MATAVPLLGATVMPNWWNEILAPLLVSLPSRWLLLAPRGSLWLLVPPSGGPCWIRNATLVLLYGHSSATLLPLSRHSTATRLPFYCHSTTTLLCHSSATLPTTLLCHPSATLLPLDRCPTATVFHSTAILLPLYCHSTATLGPLHWHSTATEPQPGTTAAQILPTPP